MPFLFLLSVGPFCIIFVNSFPIRLGRVPAYGILV